MALLLLQVQHPALPEDKQNTIFYAAGSFEGAAERKYGPVRFWNTQQVSVSNAHTRL